jgi:hypothetical protein
MEHLSSVMETATKSTSTMAKRQSTSFAAQVLQVGLATVNKDTSYLQTIKYDVFIYIHILLFIE